MVETSHGSKASEADVGGWPRWGYGAIYIFAIALFLVFDLQDGSALNGDTDDLLRALQVKQFLATGAWYDLSFPAVRMPDVYVSPWSRLVDVPYAVIAYLLAPVAGMERAVQIAFLAWPAIMGSLYGFLSLLILHRLAPRYRDLPISALLAISLLSVLAILEFTPGRIDHHNVQMLLLLCLVYGFCRWDRCGAILAGMAIASSLAVGLEMLPVLAVALVAITCVWCAGMEGARCMLQHLGSACFLSSVGLVMIEIAPPNWLVAVNDAWSAPYAFTLMAFGALAVLVPAFQHRSSFVVRALSFGIPGLAALGGILWVYPQMLDGPYPMITGLAETYWFERIYQERGFHVFFQTQEYLPIVLLLASLTIVAASSATAMRSARTGRAELLITVAICWAAVLMMIYSSRFLRIAVSVVPLLLPVAIAEFRQNYRQNVRRAAAAFICVIAVMSAALAVPAFLPSPNDDYDVFDQFVMNDCRNSSFSALDGLSPGLVAAPPALGLQILAREAPGIAVSSISFHRSAPAMNQILELFMTTDAARRAQLLTGADYLALCYSPKLLPGSEQLPLFADLLTGKTVPGIEPIRRSGDLMLFRITRERLS